MEGVSVLKASILLWLLSLPVSKYDAAEQPDARRDRLEVVADAVAHVASGDRLKAAFLLTQAQHESGFRVDVQECRCPKNQCDRGRAHGLWQLHDRPATWSSSVWWSVCGTSLDSVTLGAAYALEYYRPGRLACSFASMGGSGASCKSKWAIDRAVAARELARRL